MTGYFLTGLVLLGSAAVVFAEDNPKPVELPIKATLVAKTTTYPLELKGQSAADYKKALKEGEKDGKAPPPPAVEMTLELKNTSAKDVQLWISGDPVVLALDLKGPGAVTLKPALAFTANFIEPKAITIEAGKTHSIPLTSLRHGFRGASAMSYWTDAGDYTLSATLKTGISPVPKGVKEMSGEFGLVTLLTEPVKLKVEAK